jgi:hypothetical protein
VKLFFKQVVKTSRLAAQDRLLHLGNSLGDLDATRASLGAVEGGAATPHTLFIVQDV